MPLYLFLFLIHETTYSRNHPNYMRPISVRKFIASSAQKKRYNYWIFTGRAFAVAFWVAFAVVFAFAFWVTFAVAVSVEFVFVFAFAFAVTLAVRLAFADAFAVVFIRAWFRVCCFNLHLVQCYIHCLCRLLQRKILKTSQDVTDESNCVSEKNEG